VENFPCGVLNLTIFPNYFAFFYHFSNHVCNDPLNNDYDPRDACNDGFDFNRASQ
jgi:hypothetical protein